jgi:hypothetical protein
MHCDQSSCIHKIQLFLFSGIHRLPTALDSQTSTSSCHSLMMKCLNGQKRTNPLTQMRTSWELTFSVLRTYTRTYKQCISRANDSLHTSIRTSQAPSFSFVSPPVSVHCSVTLPFIRTCTPLHECVHALQQQL